jgi:shikimate kinase
MNHNCRIVIVGFMGCGKTSVGRRLARALGVGSIDLDSFITKHERRSPAEIIETDGEPAFRKIESRALRKVLEDSSSSVISLGGGAWTIEANRTLAADYNCFSVWLDAPFEICWKRIAGGNTNRPLAPNRRNAKSLYESRRKDYKRANLRIGIGPRAVVENTVMRIISEIEKVSETK